MDDSTGSDSAGGDSSAGDTSGGDSSGGDTSGGDTETDTASGDSASGDSETGTSGGDTDSGGGEGGTDTDGVDADGDGWTVAAGDCDDADASTYPGAAEVCDRADNDCNGTNDDMAIDTATFYYDGDGDGYGDPDTSASRCFSSTTYVEDSSDCDDTDPEVNPDGTEEVCNGKDDDCDGTDETAVYWTPTTTGTVVDLTSTFAAGTATTPASYSFNTSGDLLICDGTWYVNLFVNGDAVTVRSMSGASATILDGAGAASVIRVKSTGTVSFDGLTLQNGAGSSGYGGGLYSYTGGADITMSDCIVQDNTATDGGGAYLDSGTLVVSNTTFSGNVASDDGGGLALGDATAEISGSTFSDNSAAGYGGGIYVGVTTYTSAVFLTVESSELSGNTAANGGGIYTYYAVIEVDDTLVHDNTASYQGGGIYTDYNSSTITDSSVYENSAVYGGGLFGYWGAMSFSCTGGGGVWQNTASYGGGMHINYTGSITSTACDWGTGTTDNSASDVYLGYGGYSTSAYGASASFTCSGSSFSCY